MERVIVTKPFHGFAGMQVCAEADVTDQEILETCNIQNPSGTSNGWVEVIRNDKEHPQCNPVKCADHPERLHFIVMC